MKIGLLAYNSASNFGASLQLLSTFHFFRKHGDDPIVINYTPFDLEQYYLSSTPFTQQELLQSFRINFWKETRLCRTSADIAGIINEEQIEALIIGSDAVIQHHTFWERIVFPTRKVISLRSFTSDRLFPNPFWGDFIELLNTKIPVVMMSGSSQDSNFYFYNRKLKKKMRESLSKFSFISVRDEWTKQMISNISNKRIIPNITPDPVFAFNQNVGELLPDRDDLLKKFNIKGDYFVYSFHNSRINQKWLDAFASICESNNITCLKLPFANKDSFGNNINNISLPLSPIDWYCLIKNSCGYFGNNMHPIVIALHNAVPFYSFDNYGKCIFNKYLINEKTSKIYDILKSANHLDYRISCLNFSYTPPSPMFVYEKLRNFNCETSINFSHKQLDRYNNMMSDIIECFNNED